MSKSAKTALSVAAVMIVLGLLLCAIAVARGADIGQMVYNGDFNLYYGSVSDVFIGGGGYTTALEPAAFEPREVTSLDISWLSGSVTVESYDGDTLLVTEEGNNLAENECLRYKLSGQRLSIRYCEKRTGRLPTKDLTVRVPRGWIGETVAVDATSANVRLEEITAEKALSVDTTSGQVQVVGCSCAELPISTTSGNIQVEEVAASRLRLDAVSGRISVSGIDCEILRADTTSGDMDLSLTAASVKVNTVSGSVKLYADAGTVEAETTSGKVQIHFERLPEEVDVDTVSGGVWLNFPAGTGLALEFDSVSGRLVGQALRFADGNVPVEVDTVSGDLHVEYAD